MADPLTHPIPNPTAQDALKNVRGHARNGCEGDLEYGEEHPTAHEEGGHPMISPREQLIRLAQWDAIRRNQIAEDEKKDKEEREVGR